MGHWAHMQNLLSLRSCFFPLPLFRTNARATHFTWKWLDFQENECTGGMHFHTNGLAQRVVSLEAKVNYSFMSCSGSLWSFITGSLMMRWLLLERKRCMSIRQNLEGDRRKEETIRRSIQHTIQNKNTWLLNMPISGKKFFLITSYNDW